MRLRPQRPLTYANVTATLALFVALGGGAYAAATLPANSVGADQLQTNAVTTKKIKKNAVTAAKISHDAVNGARVRDDSLTGADIDEATLASVPSAASADVATSAAYATTADTATSADAATSAARATDADHADAAAALDAVTYRTATATAPPNSDSTAATATCDAGQRVIAGGAQLATPSTGVTTDSYPDDDGTAWTVHVANGPAIGQPHDGRDATWHPHAQAFTVYAICIPTVTNP